MASAAVPALSPAWLALAIGLLPIAIVHLCYAISVNAGHVPLCLPYLEGCTSISRAARHGMANHVFKAAMLPIAGLMSDSPAAEVAAKTQMMMQAMRDCGCKLNNAYMQHSLLALPVIPALRISDLGLVDVTTFQLTSLFAEDPA